MVVYYVILSVILYHQTISTCAKSASKHTNMKEVYYVILSVILSLNIFLACACSHSCTICMHTYVHDLKHICICTYVYVCSFTRADSTRRCVWCEEVPDWTNGRELTLH